MKRFALVVAVSACGDSLHPSTSDPDAAVVPDAPPDPTGPTGDPDGSGFGDSTHGGDPTNPFFASLGTNGRSCATCHAEADGWTITPAHVQARFAADPDDPLFRTVDGANSPLADVSTLAAKQAAYSMLLHRAVIRVGRALPGNAEFTLAAVDDPYGFASATELSLFRRPLPSTNLRFLTGVMWDGREASLEQQATDATLGHAQAAAIDASTVDAIVAFERSITTAQTFDTVAGALDADGATGGVAALDSCSFELGENDPFATGFDRDVFQLYGAWFAPPQSGGDAQAQRRAAIGRGERIFNNRPIRITNVAGLNDVLGQPAIMGTCSTCHNTSSAGSHSSALLVDLGLTGRRAPDQPLYTLQRTSDGATIQTTDPGLALSTGTWADIGRFKVPVLRALAMRPPYFHDGSAPNLGAVVGFYDQRFRLQLNPGERADLVAFLQAL